MRVFGGVVIDLHRPTSQSCLALAGLAIWLFLYFGAWAFLKPPLQSPDEGHHLVRALAVPAYPWLARSERLRVVPGAVTPFIQVPPPASLSRLFLRRDRHLDAAGIEDLKALPWPAATGRTVPAEFFTQAWSYPTPYYIAVFALGQGTTLALALDPYASLFAYRLASAALAVPLWVWVWRRLAQASQFTAWRVLLFLAVVANPMLAFLTSSVNPDAVLAPLGALALLAVLELAESGTRARSALVILLMTALAKPSGLLLLAVLVAVVLAARLLPAWRPAHAGRAILTLVAAGATAVAVFYAWSPSRTFGATLQAGPDALAAMRWLWRAWKSYWGTPGYLDYWLPNGWYLALTALWLVNAALAARSWFGKSDATRRAACFIVAVAALSAVAIVAGSLASIPGLRFSVQGRYLLPVGLGFAAVLIHGRPTAAWAFMVWLGLVHVALAHESVTRYFGGDYTLLLRALPWQ